MSPSTTSRRQRGAALLVAMLILTLVATMAAGMVWLQWRGIEVETAERARAQAQWLLNGALDWARIILRSDARNIDHLGEPWAVPLAETRLSAFLASDSNHSDDSGPNAFLSGQITDAQGRYNLTRLVEAQSGGPKEAEVKNLQRLCEALNVPLDVADEISDGLSRSRQASDNSESESKDLNNAILIPHRIADLAWYGIDGEILKQLQPFVALLPKSTTLNINTAPAEVLMAVIPGLDRGSAQRVLQTRQQTPFTDATGLSKVLSPALMKGLQINNLTTKSDFFEVIGQIRYEDYVIRERTLVERRGNDMVTLRRERLTPDAP